MAAPLYLHRAAQQTTNRRNARTISRPAPGGGLNVLDDVGDVKPDQATKLWNWWSDSDSVDQRPGHAEHADTGTGLQVRTLINHELGASAEMFAASGGSIWNVTTAGAVPTEAARGFGSDNWSFASISANTLAVNDHPLDYPQRYDGTSWVPSTFSSDDVDVRLLKGVMEHGERLFLWPGDSLDFYYGGVGAVQGALERFPLSNLGNMGGVLVAGGSWTVDAGDGVQDVATFITSRGDMILYQGTDPGDASNWSLLGRFKVADPVGLHRAVMNYGPDMIVMTSDGFLSLRGILAEGPASRQRAISRKIYPLVRDVVEESAGDDGWDSVYSPDGSMLIFSAPGRHEDQSDYIQFVYNPLKKGWFPWRGLPSVCWGQFNQALYIGDKTGKVHRVARDILDDDGADIVKEYHSRWDGMENQNVLKKLFSAQFIMICDGQYDMRMTTLSDFQEGGEDIAATQQTVTLNAPGAPWDDTAWDIDYWAGDNRHFDWIPATAWGYRMQIRSRISSKGLKFKWRTTKFQVNFLSGQK